jgi:hypothetical protein
MLLTISGLIKTVPDSKVGGSSASLALTRERYRFTFPLTHSIQCYVGGISNGTDR